MPRNRNGANSIDSAIALVALATLFGYGTPATHEITFTHNHGSKNERNPLHRGWGGGHCFPRGVYSPMSDKGAKGFDRPLVVLLLNTICLWWRRVGGTESEPDKDFNEEIV